MTNDLLLSLSQQYGSGNPIVDMLIVSGILSMLFFVSSVKMLAKQEIAAALNGYPEAGENSFSTQSIQVVNELRIVLDGICRDVQVSAEHIKAETGFLKQEFNTIRAELQDMKHTLRTKNFADGVIHLDFVSPDHIEDTDDLEVAA